MIATRMIALLIISLLFAGCAGATPSAIPTTPPAAITATRQASSVPKASSTPLPTHTALPSPTATITQTPTSTPDPALAEVRLLGVSWLANYDLLLSIQFPGPVDPAQYRVRVEDKDYACQGLAQQPNRLFCIGQGMNVYDRVSVQIFPAGSDRPGFEGKIYIPYFNE